MAGSIRERVAGFASPQQLKASRGYHVETTDGEIGHVDGFVLDDEARLICYFQAANAEPVALGKKVLVSPAWIERVSWPESKVYVALSRGSYQRRPRVPRVQADYSGSFRPPPFTLRPAALLATNANTNRLFH